MSVRFYIVLYHIKERLPELSTTNQVSSTLTYNKAMEDNKLPISKAIDVLILNISNIDSTFEWSQKMHWTCPVHFSRNFKRMYGIRPSQLLIDIKVKIAIDLIQCERQISCFDISKHIGKRDDKALNKFLKYHTGHPPSWFRKNQSYQFKFDNKFLSSAMGKLKI